MFGDKIQEIYCMTQLPLQFAQLTPRKRLLKQINQNIFEMGQQVFHNEFRTLANVQGKRKTCNSIAQDSQALVFSTLFLGNSPGIK